MSDELILWLKSASESLAKQGFFRCEVRVRPGAKHSEVRSVMVDGTLKVSVRAAPEQGKANEEVKTILADFFGVLKGEVNITHGHATSRKGIEIQRDS